MSAPNRELVHNLIDDVDSGAITLIDALIAALDADDLVVTDAPATLAIPAQGAGTKIGIMVLSARVAGERRKDRKCLVESPR